MPPPVETMISGLRVESTPLLFEYAQPMIPQIAEILAIASQDLASLVASGVIKKDENVLDPKVIMALMPAMRNLAAHLDGKLERLAPRLLATTRVAVPNAEGVVEWHDMSSAKDRSYVFDTHPDIYFPLVIHAGRTTFGRFFPAAMRGSQKGSKEKAE